VQAEEGAGQVEQPLQQICPPLVTDPQATTAEQPGEGALDDPPVSPQPLARIDPAPRDPRSDAAGPQGTAQVRGVVRLVGVELGRALARPPRFPPRADDRGDRVDQGNEQRRVVGVSGGEVDGQGDAVAVDDHVVFGAGLASVSRVGTDLLAPLFARTLKLSTLARDQSMAASSPSQFKSRSCSFCQTPASCQSRSRRQQVVPLPHPSSFGNKRHGQPVRSTKTMPPRAARSQTRGRPPLGFGGSFGSRDSMASHSSSGTRDEAFMAYHHATPLRF
jgi:hypothetical protein